MFEFLIFILVSSFYLSLILAGIMFAYRVYLAAKTSTDWVKRLCIGLLPLGFGVFLYVKDQRLLKVYRAMILCLCILSLFASLFLFHRVLGL